MKKLYDAIGRFEWGLAAVGAGLCLFSIMIITVLSVFGRYALHMDLIPGAYNIIERMLFPLMVFWALPLAHRDGFFPRLELMADALPPRQGAIAAIVVLIVELVLFLFILRHMVVFSYTSLVTDRMMQLGSGYFPVWPFIMMVPLAFGLMIIEMLWQIARSIRYFATGRPAPRTHVDPLASGE